MTEPPFTIRYDPAEHILHMRLCGFWSLLTLASYTARLLAETTRLRNTRYDILSDSRGFEVQGRAVSAGFEAIARRGAERHHGRTAIVVGSHLNQAQARRTLDAPRTRIFLDIAEARAWLKRPEAAAA